MGKKKKNRDLCPVCSEDLKYDNYVTQRIGLLAEDDYTVEGWMCPHCKSQFDLKDNLLHIVLLICLWEEHEKKEI